MGFWSSLKDKRTAFLALSLYERFEQLVFVALTLLISIVIAVAVGHLSIRIFSLVLLSEIDFANQEVLQSVFGMIMTVLIALEFNHSMLAVFERHHSIVQVRTVILIALLALVRKFIILDVLKVGAMTLIGLALSAISLGAVYWLVRDQEGKDEDRRASAAISAVEREPST